MDILNTNWIILLLDRGSLLEEIKTSSILVHEIKTILSRFLYLNNNYEIHLLKCSMKINDDITQSHKQQTQQYIYILNQNFTTFQDQRRHTFRLISGALNPTFHNSSFSRRSEHCCSIFLLSRGVNIPSEFALSRFVKRNGYCKFSKKIKIRKKRGISLDTYVTLRPSLRGTSSIVLTRSIAPRRN